MFDAFYDLGKYDYRRNIADDVKDVLSDSGMKIEDVTLEKFRDFYMFCAGSGADVTGSCSGMRLPNYYARVAVLTNMDIVAQMLYEDYLDNSWFCKKLSEESFEPIDCEIRQFLLYDVMRQLFFGGGFDD